MASLFRRVEQVTRLFSRLSVSPIPATQPRLSGSYPTKRQPFVGNTVVRQCSSYDPYQTVENPPSPFKQRGKDRIGYKLKIYTGGKTF